MSNVQAEVKMSAEQAASFLEHKDSINNAAYV